jgi:hypothetical protein
MSVRRRVVAGIAGALVVIGVGVVAGPASAQTVGPIVYECGGIRSVSVTSSTTPNVEHRYQGVNHSGASYEWSYFNLTGGTKTSYSGMRYGQYQIISNTVHSHSVTCRD